MLVEHARVPAAVLTWKALQARWEEALRRALFSMDTFSPSTCRTSAALALTAPLPAALQSTNLSCTSLPDMIARTSLF